MKSNRRQFVQAVAIAAAAGLHRTALADADVPIVDTHQHLWDQRRFDLRWTKSSPILNRSFLIDDYDEATRGLGFVQAVYMEVAVDDADQQAEADWIADVCRRRQTITRAAVVSGPAEADSFPAYIGRWRGNRHIKGVRRILKPAASGRVEIGAQLVANVRLLGEMGLRFDLCMPAGELARGLQLVKACPATRFVVDHCGNADPKAFMPAAAAASHDVEAWRRDMAALAGCPNTVCKISGIVSRAPEGWTAETLAPIVRHCLDVFGDDRVMFGSDWPVCLRGATLREWVEALRTIVAGRSESQRRKLFADNAVRFYELDA